ncbi:alpha/beta fold hydrolase [Rathayibacter soli]|uniref:alpha/beta fold hydrolase n=1 Tax=Rathayibacter soli TaxID=3144168 RepID=UPI0027E3CD5C|nr:hypothetical protein [Glaciibacter superstes]
MPYAPTLWASDLRAVAHHLGYQRFLFFGCSFIGALRPWLALRLAKHQTVAAVVSGGFPLLGDYGIASRDVDAQMEQLERGPESWAKWDLRFDPRAGAAFYRDLTGLAPNGLVDNASCPLFGFWGDRDRDAIEMVLPHSVLALGLTRRDVPWKQYPGYDHERLNSDLKVAWSDAETWLLKQTHELRLCPPTAHSERLNTFLGIPH